MNKVRVLGPREQYPEALCVLQDTGVVHLTVPGLDGRLLPLRLSTWQERESGHLRRLLVDVEALLEALPTTGAGVGEASRAGHPGGLPARRDLTRWARLVSGLRPEVLGLRGEMAALAEEHALLSKYGPFLSTFGVILRSERAWPHIAAYHVILPAQEESAVAGLKTALVLVLGEGFALETRRLPGGDIALLMLVPEADALRVESLLAAAGVHEIPVPSGYEARSLAQALPRMMDRLESIPQELREREEELERLTALHRHELCNARRGLHDRLRTLGAMPLLGATQRVFVIEGWVPVAESDRLAESLATSLGGETALEVIDDHPRGEDVPVALRNPGFLRPFEIIVRLLPLPSYGTVDPTPLVAGFFPLFFGFMLGDVGYALVLAALALLLARRSTPGSLLRSVAAVAGTCAFWSLAFGVAFGEAFGNLGREHLGIHAVVFDREEALESLLLLAVAFGFVHILLGLALGVFTTRRHPREAAGRALTAGIVVAGVVALGVVVGYLPEIALLPAAGALVVALVALVAVEGVLAFVELLSAFGNILSYSRLMAIGTASMMLAVVANDLGSAVSVPVLGVFVAVLFHLVNFVLGVFSPTIHSLRLHYVEFFGKFYRPGGMPYRPFGHWDPGAGWT
ncbi:MAG: hypothetical protein KKA32_09605 [Actinobacteria bacterium]|nr:hypothetical protein [Actinomycetota bacterium]